MDYDIAGIETSEKFYDILADRKIRCDKLMPEYKDWNEDLKASLNLSAIPREEHPPVYFTGQNLFRNQWVDIWT